MKQLLISIFLAIAATTMSCTGTLWSRDTVLPDNTLSTYYYNTAVVSIGADNRPAILAHRSVTVNQSTDKTISSGLRQELVLLRTDVNGQLMQSFVLHQTSQLEYNRLLLQATPDSGFVALYSANGESTGQLAKIGPLGNVVWRKSFTPFSGTIRPYSLVLDVPGNIFVGGYYFSSPTGPAACIVKLTPEGTVVWARSFANFLPARSFGYTLTLTPGGGCVLSGQIGPADNSVPKQSFMLKTNENGVLDWARMYQTPAILAHLPLPDGYLLTGQLTTNNGFPIYLAKVSPNGTRQWYRDDLLAGFYNLPVSLFADQGRYTILGNGSTPVQTPANGFLWAQFDDAGNPLGRQVITAIKGPNTTEGAQFGNVVNWLGQGYLTTGGLDVTKNGVELSLIDYSGQLRWNRSVVRGR